MNSDDAPSKKDVLRRSLLLNILSEEHQSIVLMNSTMTYAEKGEVIWFRGSTVDFFGVVGNGFVKMSRVSGGGQEITTEIMGPGQVFGLLGALDGGGCPQTSKAVTGTWYLRVRKAEFLPIYDSSVILKEKLVSRTTLRLRQSFDMIAHLSSGKVEQRIAAVLLILCDSFGQDHAKGTLLNVPLTRQDISEIAGTTVESTIRVMSKWQKNGWIATRAQQILIKEIESLISTVSG